MPPSSSQYSIFPYSDKSHSALVNTTVRPVGSLNHTPRAKPAGTVSSRLVASGDQCGRDAPVSSVVTVSGLRSRDHSRLAHCQEHADEDRSRSFPVNEQAPIPSRAAFPRGLRHHGDTIASPASSHMSRKARQLEAQITSKAGISTPDSVSTLTSYGNAHTTGPHSHSYHIRRKPLPPAIDALHQLKPRPSSPTLVDTFQAFDSPPRSPPSTPITTSCRSSSVELGRTQRFELKSMWDDFDEDITVNTHVESDDEKSGLVERVKSLTLARGRRSTASHATRRGGECHREKQRAKRRSWWKGALLCGCPTR